MGYLDTLRALGFDESYNIPFTKTYKVKCSACEALSINNTPCHESGCPNMVHECEGCDVLIQYKGYCEDCR
jgi:hypothetical protein